MSFALTPVFRFPPVFPASLFSLCPASTLLAFPCSQCLFFLLLSSFLTLIFSTDSFQLCFSNSLHLNPNTCLFRLYLSPVIISVLVGYLEKVGYHTEGRVCTTQTVRSGLWNQHRCELYHCGWTENSLHCEPVFDSVGGGNAAHLDVRSIVLFSSRKLNPA